MKVKSIRFKTTLLFSGILLVILIVYNVALFFSVKSILISETDRQLEVKAGEISNIFQAYEKIQNISSRPISVLENLLRSQGVVNAQTVVIDQLWKSEFETLKLNKDYINIVNDKGKTILYSSNLDKKIKNLLLEKLGFSKDKIYFKTVTGNIKHFRAINLPLMYKKNLPLMIQVATPLDSVYQFLTELMIVTSICMVIVLFLTSFLGGFFVKKILSPVVTVSNTANNISHRDLGVRVPSKELDIEMKQLVTSFNGMIERLEKSFKHINEFNSYVSHELKTPLAIVRGELELAIEQINDKDENKKVLLECLEEVDRMIKVVKDLLLLTKLDYKPQILKFEKIDFEHFFNEIVEHTKILSGEKQIKVSFDFPDEKIIINADRVHLRRLFLNIIVNAIKFTPKGGGINLETFVDKKNVFINISDTGVGIAEDDLDKIFNKFFRIDNSEFEHEAGFGLGLSIALSIVNAHQGSIKVKSELNKGTTFTVILPLDN